MTKPNTTASYEINQRQLRDEEAKKATARRKEVVLAGGNCLTCKHTKTKAGIWLICKLKDKNVSQYNYCDRYIAVNSSEKEETNNDY